MALCLCEPQYIVMNKAIAIGVIPAARVFLVFLEIAPLPYDDSTFCWWTSIWADFKFGSIPGILSKLVDAFSLSLDHSDPAIPLS